MKKILKDMKMQQLNGSGFTLIEVMAVILVLGIVAGIGVPSVLSLIERSREDVCEVNRLQIEKDYKMYLACEDENVTIVGFRDFFLATAVRFVPLEGRLRL